MLYVVAVGGNALTDAKILSSLSAAVVKLHRQGHKILITHGNGPQVGKLATAEKEKLSLLTAQTQAEIGIGIEDAIRRAGKHQINTAVVLTKVLVHGNDSAFANPTKPIGRFLSKKEAMGLRRSGLTVRLLRHGYRRVVPSPTPVRAFESKLIKKLLESGYVVIAGGGGGIPVVRKGNSFSYVDAVVDKDATSSLLATELKADRLFVLTNIDGAFLNLGKKGERMLTRTSCKEILQYAKDGQFEEGSMLPKVIACAEFSRKSKKISVIGNLKKSEKVLLKQNGCTLITP